MDNPTFTPGQIEGAVRQGLRGDRSRYEPGSAEAAQKSVPYGNNTEVQRPEGEVTDAVALLQTLFARSA